MDTELDLAELRSAIDKIFEHIIAERKVTKLAIPIDKDYYWELSPSKLYQVGASQPQLDVGRLSDDWEFVSKILTDERQALGIMLSHVAPLLRFISESEGG